MELMSTRMVPAAAPSSTPFAPRTACSTSGPSGSIVITTSDRAATSLHDCPARGAIRHNGVGQRGYDIIGHYLMAGFHEVPRHGPAHDAEADKSDLRHWFSFR